MFCIQSLFILCGTKNSSWQDIHVTLHVVPFQFGQGSSRSKDNKWSLYSLFGNSSCCEWFAKFKKGESDLGINDSIIDHRNLKVMTCNLFLMMISLNQCWNWLKDLQSVTYLMIVRYLQTKGKIKKEMEKWIPHELSEQSIEHWLTACSSLLARYEKLKNIFMEDCQWS